MSGMKRSKRRVKRTMVDADGFPEGHQRQHEAEAEEEEFENEFERERADRIRRNKEIMQQLGMQATVKKLEDKVEKICKPKTPAKRKPPARKREVNFLAPAATRKSARIRGVPAKLLSFIDLEDVLPNDEEVENQNKTQGVSAPEMKFSQEEYFKLIGEEVKPILISDAHFKGWVNPEVCRIYGIEENAEDAWERNGGGKWSREIDKRDIPSDLKAKGWSDARAYSSTQLKKNPNSYFYRHVAPHQKQAHGEWTEEEHQLFLETAKKYGVGDKWGLFASYIPNRVGYQCSAYYRDVIVARGLIFDRRFKITRSGKARFDKAT